MGTPIKFGTSGWRAMIAEDFTVANVRRAVNGIAEYVAAKNPNHPRLIVGRDPRFMGKTFVGIREQLQELFNQVGSFYPVRENFRLTPEMKEKFTKKVATDPAEFFGRKVKQVVRTDGLKLVLDDGSWVCYRLSGTERVVRVYTEARTGSDSDKLTEMAKQWVLN